MTGEDYAEELPRIPGPAGATGATGAASTVAGPMGPPGMTGDDYAEELPRVPGPQGIAGPTGPTGSAGPTGSIGPPGTSGEDYSEDVQRIVNMSVLQLPLSLAQGGTGTTLAATGAGVLRQTAVGALVTVGQALDYILLRDEKTSGTSGGTFTSGAWQTRTLNTISADTGSICSLGSNQFTLPAGTYRIRARAPGLQCTNHVARLQNVTDGTTVIVGSTSYCHNTAGIAQTDSWVTGHFTIGASKTFELQHQCLLTAVNNGFGTAAALGTEVYAEVQLWKEVV